MRSAFCMVFLSLLIFGDVFAATHASVSRQTMDGSAMRRNTRTETIVRGADVQTQNSVSANGTAAATIIQEININSNNVTGLSEESLTEINARRDACLLRAGQAAGTFVWASRNSNTDNYASMVEDVTNPANNVCFVKVSVQNSDDHVDTHDIPSRYFAMGQSVTCGNWLNVEDLKARVLDAGKSRRVWGSVATSLAGAGVGVGVSEGAMAIAAKQGSNSSLLGQKALEEKELLISQIKKLKQDNIAEYNRVINALMVLDETCDKEWECDKPVECDENKNPFRKLYGQLGDK